VDLGELIKFYVLGDEQKPKEGGAEMKESLKICFIFLLITFTFLFSSLPAKASLFGWKVFDTEHARVFYKPGYEKIAIRYLYC